MSTMKAALPWILLGFTTGAAIQAQTITSLSPASTPAGGPSFTLTIKGVGFNSYFGRPIALWNGQNLTATLSSDFQQIMASVPAGLIVTPGTANIQVRIATYSANITGTAGPSNIGRIR